MRFDEDAGGFRRKAWECSIRPTSGHGESDHSQKARLPGRSKENEPGWRRKVGRELGDVVNPIGSKRDGWTEEVEVEVKLDR